MEIYTKVDKCRLCGSSKLEGILSLGDQCISAFVGETDSNPIVAPLDLIKCSNCQLVQLRHSTNPKILYSDNYGYRSGLNTTMMHELRNLVDSILALKRLKTGDVVVDIGSSDGTMLKFYPDEVIKVGFEPVKKFKNYYSQRGFYYIGDFFNAEAYQKQFPNHKAKVISAIAMFYDLDDPNAFLKDVTKVLAEDGILVIQQNYLPKMLERGAFDNISHEHVAYYSLNTLHKLVSQHKLEIFDVEERGINGGSFRTYICFKGMYAVEPTLAEMLETEKIDFGGFQQRVEDCIDQLTQFITQEKAKGKTFWIYGASTRGNVILQAANLKYPLIEGASERNPEKWGKRTLGTNIPIYSEEEARKVKPDYFLVLPYWFRDEFIEREKEYLEGGGALIFPLPEFKIERR